MMGWRDERGRLAWRLSWRLEECSRGDDRYEQRADPDERDAAGHRSALPHVLGLPARWIRQSTPGYVGGFGNPPS